MGDQNWMDLLSGQMMVSKLMEANAYTRQYGLALTQQDTELLLSERRHALKQERRVEVGQGILPKIIYEFCDSAYISQDNYVETLIRLQEIFYLYKNEMMDEITDDELLHFMKEQMETVCYGDLEYLESTCLEIFARAIRAGYRDYQESEGYGAFSQLDDVPRWDKGLYLSTLQEELG